jgi:hypothetical protein
MQTCASDALALSDTSAKNTMVLLSESDAVTDSLAKATATKLVLIESAAEPDSEMLATIVAMLVRTSDADRFSDMVSPSDVVANSASNAVTDSVKDLAYPKPLIKSSPGDADSVSE